MPLSTDTNVHQGRHQRMSATVRSHQDIVPEDWLRFIELRIFTEDWRSLRLKDEDLAALQALIMCGPDSSPVVPGTGGLRKCRFAPSSWGKGKRGAARVCYAYYPDHAVVLLVTAYAKKTKDDLTEAEKQAIKELLRRFERWLERDL